jgi:hypothetical protein
MSRVKGIQTKEGDIPNATDLNQVFTEVEAMTIDDTNTRDNWATTKNFQTNVGSYVPMNEVFRLNQTAGTWTTTSTTFVDVFSTSLAINIPLESDAPKCVRVSWDALIGDNILVDDSGGAGDNNRENNLYAFRVKVTLSNGTSDYIAPGVYSFSGRAFPTPYGGLTPGPINWRSCAGSDFVITNNVGINNVYLQAKVGNSANTLEVDRFNLSVVVGRK